jgi:ParB-like chromosome segregation protein Spo0J
MLGSSVKAAFEPTIVRLQLDGILRLRQVTPNQRESAKYKRIANSIQEVGIIEPPVVARPKDGDSKYLLLDGHVRIDILAAMDETEVACLISDDDEGFTYNKRVARLATIQEYYMIVRALDRGVSEEKLAKALNVDVDHIARRRSLLDGICPEVIDLLKDKSVNPVTFDVIRKMKPGRQIEAAELMAVAGNYSAAYAKALLAATRQHDLVHPERPKKINGLTPEQMAKMEREMESLQRDFKVVEASYGDDFLNLVVATGYLNKLIGNTEIQRYLDSRYPELLQEFRVIITATSLDQSGGAELREVAPPS